MFKTYGIYSDGMVLQQQTVNCICGAADADAPVTLKWDGKEYNSQADSKGQWKIEFETSAAGGPYSLELKCQNQKILFSDVYVGEVWVSSGQSNAQLPMSRMAYSYPEEFDLPENPFIRMCTVPIRWNFEGEQKEVENPCWKTASPQTLGEMSGTAYFFAKKLSQELKVPVGIINASQGGSPIASWMSKESLISLGKKDLINEEEKWEVPSAVTKKMDEVNQAQKEWNDKIWASDKGIKEHWERLTYSEVENNWVSVPIPGVIEDFEGAGIVWFKKEITLTAKQAEDFNSQKTNLWFGTIVDADRIYVNGVEIGVTYYLYPPRRYVVPAGLLKEGKNTITIRVQKNSRAGKIRFYTEKPYCLFTDDIKVPPVAFRNVEIQASIKSEDFSPFSQLILLDGMWKMAYGTVIEDAPEQKFFEWVPTALYNGMLSPCFNYAVKGALWYQGESDVERYDQYQDMLYSMIELWRKKFTYAKKDMPFIVVQLPNWSDGWSEKEAMLESGLASMREVQAKVTESLPATGLTVTIDAGEWNDLHPEKKYTVGCRSALEALRIAYNQDYPPAPKALSFEKTDSSLLVTFDCGKSFLTPFNNSLADYIPGFSFVYKKGEESCLVEMAGKLISDTQVEVPLPAVDGKLLELRYLWADSPNPVCLYSGMGLPAAPFRFVL